MGNFRCHRDKKRRVLWADIGTGFTVRRILSHVGFGYIEKGKPSVRVRHKGMR